MQKRKIVFGLMIAVLLLGCGNVEKEAVQKPEETELTIYYGTVHDAEMMNVIAQDYQEKTGIKIEWMSADNGSVELKKKIALGEAPDMFSLAQFELSSWEGYLYDLSNESWKRDIYEDSIEAASVEGKLVAWPHALEASGIVYNKKLFREAGIEDTPKTLEELEAVCETLKNSGIQSFGESWMEFGYLAHVLAAPFTLEEDVETISDEIYQGKKGFESLKYIDNMFTFFDLTLEYGLAEESVVNNTLSQYPAFANGDMAMMKQGTWSERSLKAIKEDYEIGIFPVPLSNRPEENRLQVATTTFLCVNKESEHVEEILDFIQWWHQHAKEYLIEIDDVIPPFHSTASVENIGQLNTEMLDYIEEGNIYNGFGYEYWPNEFQKSMSNILQSYALKQLSRQEACEALDALYRS